MRDLVYLDTSALVKLALPEQESSGLLEGLVRWPERVTSVVAEIELRRAVRRATADPRAHRRAEEVLAGLFLLELDAPVRQEAANLDPATLRALDAIHLASALTLRDDLAAFVAYDHRLIEAAGRHGLVVARPGVE